jgi:hypothetical protein
MQPELRYGGSHAPTRPYTPPHRSLAFSLNRYEYVPPVVTATLKACNMGGGRGTRRTEDSLLGLISVAICT